LRHANGCHWGRFVRTILEIEADNGLIGLGEMGGGGESAEGAIRALKGYLVGHDPARPGWTPAIPNDRWADPDDDRCPQIPF
jgi:L-alanine-DL-glutamate epimerase-like enolase superfamily enzyme